MVSFKVLYRKDRPTKNHKYPLVIRITKNSKSSYLNLGIKVKASEFNEASQKLKPAFTNYIKWNRRINDQLDDLKDIYLEYQKKSGYYTAKMIRDEFTKSDEENFTDFFKTWIETRYERRVIKIGTYRRYKSIYDKFKSFRKNPLLFKDVNYALINDFDAYLCTTYENQRNTINANLKGLKACIQEAIRQDKIEVSKNPFIKYRFTHVTPERQFLNEDELSRFINLTPNKESKLACNTHKICMLISQTGIRISDILTMRWSNYDGQSLRFKVTKTDAIAYVPLTCLAISIIDSYISKDIANDEYIFPLLRVKHNEEDVKAIHSAIKAATALINKTLKNTLLPLAKIDKTISTNKFRHTFATLALQRNVSMFEVSSVMKHSSIKTTEIYAKAVDSISKSAITKFEQNGLSIRT